MTIDWTSITAIITVAITSISTTYTNHKNNKNSYRLKEIEITSNLKLKESERLDSKYESLFKEYYKSSEIREKILHFYKRLEEHDLNLTEMNELDILLMKLLESSYRLSIFLNEEEYESYKKGYETFEQDLGKKTEVENIINLSYSISSLIESKFRSFNNI